MDLRVIEISKLLGPSYILDVQDFQVFGLFFKSLRTEVLKLLTCFIIFFNFIIVLIVRLRTRNWIVEYKIINQDYWCNL